MRYAVISDIHSNLEAFQAVLDGIAELHADRILCLGDVAGYHADPNACIELLREKNITSILGNHDAAACGFSSPHDFNPIALEAILWTRRHVTPENSDFLRTLPRELQVNGLFLCHGTIHDTNHYILSHDDVRDAFELMAELPGAPRICLHGHSHLPSAFRFQNSVIARERGELLTLSPSAAYLINPGSVGQPRDGDPRAAFLIHDDAVGTVTFFRVDYDRETCQNKIIAAGLPAKLALRLALGQ